MGRAPCCDKANVKKGPWSPEEDAKLKSYIEQHGTGGNWIALPPKIGLKRCGKSCRLRWLNYLRPNIKHGGFSEEEDTVICSLYMSIGSRWSIIAAQLPGRTDNDIKNYWNTRLKKKLLGRPRNKELQHGRRGAAGVGKQLGAPKIAENEAFSGPPCGAAAQYSPRWPQQPPAATCPNLQRRPVANDQASLRRLLMKLGGRSFDDSAGTPDVQPPAAPSPATAAYDGHLDAIAAPSASEAGSFSDGLDEKTDLLGEDVLRGTSNTPGCFTTELDEIFCFNPAKLDGLDELSGIGNTTESLVWNDMINPLVHAPLISNYHHHHQQCYILHEQVELGNIAR